jgi:hypothetical protein
VRVARLVVAVFLLTGACGGESPAAKGAQRPQTAAARAKTEKADAGEAAVDGAGKKWGGWRYQGRRDDCFFVVGRKCFDNRDDACTAARCGKNKCVVAGGGPATVRCGGD